jgi:class 3 adenylate cyclase
LMTRRSRCKCDDADQLRLPTCGCGDHEAALRNITLALERSISDAEGERIAFPIHIDDIIGEPHDIVGDGVTFGARLERIAEPGGTRISSSASGLRQVRDRICRSRRVEPQERRPSLLS